MCHANLHSGGDISHAATRLLHPVIWVRQMEELREDIYNWYLTIRAWSGSAWLSGETPPIQDTQYKVAIYADLCRLGNHMSAWQDDVMRIRNEALEEAAQLCESKLTGGPNHIVARGFAEEVRALKTPPQSPDEVARSASDESPPGKEPA